MPTLPTNQTESLPVRQMGQADRLKMPEDSLHRLIIQAERDPRFRRLHQKEKLIRYQRFRRTDIPSRFCQPRQGVTASKGSPDAEPLLPNNEPIVRQIQKLGQEKFKRYFLFPESGMSTKEIAIDCGLEVAEVQKINSLIDEFSVMSEFYHPSTISSGRIRYSKIASVENDEKGLVISYFSAFFARGRYSIDYYGFEKLKAAGAFTEAEVKEARQLFRRLALINRRKDALNRILQNIIDKQALYLESGDLKSLLPFSQKELAQQIGLTPSSVSQAINGRSIDTPWGREIPVKDLFPRPKRFRKELLRQLLETDSELASDEAIRNKLWEKFGVAISRRSVANLRKELRFPAAQGRQNEVVGRKTG